jgi:hypothetical protein
VREKMEREKSKKIRAVAALACAQRKKTRRAAETERVCCQYFFFQ